ncbi:MAG TPA: D-glycero-beta-D-manno-heptose-7-phosphate kinase [Candidatus Cloacimonadota bacterium]|nr:D-glycero-beta-D-manno-heptose-7-phosphate kinase [Candidatus Cloacimonadota bacterium]HPK40572.1 D-glycero-beta-D-manno-heptose-7-phosphate kinase [Candidatus Cloacimonadota bacterium]
MEVKKVFKKFAKQKIAVIGDLMLDHYLWGTVDRISPEAPVPVVDIKREEYRLGGAANVISNITSLNAIADAYGICGQDKYAEILENLLDEIGVNKKFIIADHSRPTTLKSRIMAGHQQVTRCDFEKRHYLSEEVENKLLEKLEENVNSYSAIILEDYNKGLLSERIITETIKLAQKHNIPVTVDPKFINFFNYKEVDVFKPNLNELQKNLGIEIHSEDQLRNAAKEIFQRINPKYLVVTRGEKGLIIFNRKMEEYIIPTFAREVFDVSGAGDTMISVLTICLACNCDIKEAAIIANHASGAVCGKIGISPVTQKDIELSIEYNKIMKDS